MASLEKPTRRRRTRKTGLPPGTLVHIGEKRNFDAQITIFQYDTESWREIKVDQPEDCFPYRDLSAGVAWINIDGIHKIDLVEKIGKHFNLHPLTLEDIVNNEQRPKFEEHDHYIYIVLRMLFPERMADGAKPTMQTRIISEQVSLILGSHYVISFQESIVGDVFGSVRDRIRNNHGKMRKMGADYLAYALMDAIVDHYFVILEKMGEKFELLEVELLAEPQQKTLITLQGLKRDMIDLRRSILPLREVVSSLQRTDSPLVQEITRKYLRDVYDHIINVNESMEGYRDLLAGMLEIYLTSINNHLNSVMKVLTMIATIFIPLTFVVGVYGMNFKHMPELEWEYGYLLVWGCMLLIGGAMVLYFKRRKWL